MKHSNIPGYQVSRGVALLLRIDELLWSHQLSGLWRGSPAYRKTKKTTSGLTRDDTKLWPRCDMYTCLLFCFFTLLAPTIKLWATLAMKPSTWTPRSLHKIRRKGKTKELTNCRIQIMPLIKCYPAVKCTSTDAGSNQIKSTGKDKRSFHFGKLA